MKSVKFNSKVAVILIPCANEYHQISADLWWNSEDFKRFKLEFYYEISNLINLSRNKFETELINKNLELNEYNFFKLAYTNLFQ
jgi:hypothetical protein